MEMIWPGCEPKYFCKGGWTGESAGSRKQKALSARGPSRGNFAL
jgi:hypothetical protein